MYIFSTNLAIPFRPAFSLKCSTKTRSWHCRRDILRVGPHAAGQLWPSRSPRVEAQFRTLESEQIFRTFVRG